jgi:hypothetical protein
MAELAGFLPKLVIGEVEIGEGVVVLEKLAQRVDRRVADLVVLQVKRYDALIGSRQRVQDKVHLPQLVM